MCKTVTLKKVMSPEIILTHNMIQKYVEVKALEVIKK